MPTNTRQKVALVLASGGAKGFAHIGAIEALEESGYEITLPCCCTNGYQGYYPMMECYAEGGYEAGSSPFAPGCAEKLIEICLDLAKKLK